MRRAVDSGSADTHTQRDAERHYLRSLIGVEGNEQVLHIYAIRPTNHVNGVEQDTPLALSNLQCLHVRRSGIARGNSGAKFEE